MATIVVLTDFAIPQAIFGRPISGDGVYDLKNEPSSIVVSRCPPLSRATHAHFFGHSRSRRHPNHPNREQPLDRRADSS